MAKKMGARIQVVEMPPGPPVLQTVVAEIYGPTEEVRRQTARDMTKMFEKSKGIVDVDNYLSEPHEYWRFVVNTEKAVRRGISVDVINQNIAMAMGGYKLGDIKRKVVLEPTFIILQVPLTVRSQISRLKNLPIMSSDGTIVPLAELGHFEKSLEDEIIYHKDLRAIEYVTGEMEGKLGAPIYGMYEVEDQLEKYKTADGITMSGMPWGLIGPPSDDSKSGFEWSGEWTVTYETFRDMGAAFMVALVLIYGLIVWEFKNFTIAGVIMAPIPLTLIGIIPGHWIMGAEFTATSMIGFIALAGIIVRNSILLVEFVKNEVGAGMTVVDAVIAAGQIRMRPIFITALTLMAGAAAIINDPIFQGMAAALLFGTGVATILTLMVIPLGCISAGKQFYLMNELPFPDEEDNEPEKRESANNNDSIINKTKSFIFTSVAVLRGVASLVRTAINSFLERNANKEKIKAKKTSASKKKVTRKKKVVKKEITDIAEKAEKEIKEKETTKEVNAVSKKKASKRTTKKKRRGIKLKNIGQKQENKDDEK